MTKADSLLATFLAMGPLLSTQHSTHDKPEDKPSSNRTKQFRKTKAKRKLAQASRRRNRG